MIQERFRQERMGNKEEELKKIQKLEEEAKKTKDIEMNLKAQIEMFTAMEKLGCKMVRDIEHEFYLLKAEESRLEKCLQLQEA